MPLPKLSVIIPTFDRRDILSRTLPSVFSQTAPSDSYEVIVVVDGSTDGTSEMLESLQPPCPMRVLSQPNRGQAAARNAGVRIARGEVVLFLDDDALCHPALVAEHLSAQDDSGNLLVFGPVLVADESPHSLAAEWMRSWTADYLRRIAGQSHVLLPNEVWVCTNSSIRREILVSSGGFDERMRSHEDAELAIRLAKMGVAWRYESKAIAYYIYVKSPEELVRKDAGSYGKNEVLLCRKHPEYRRHSFIAAMTSGSALKRLGSQILGRAPISPEPLLRPPFWMAEFLDSVPAFRRAGVRLLRHRHAIAAMRSAVKEMGSWHQLRSEFGMQLPVLIYHRVAAERTGLDAGLTLSRQQFERDVRWLSEHGYVGIRPADWLAWLRDGQTLPPKPVLVTFDDAYADLVDNAFPVLLRYGFGAAVFVPTRHIGGTNAWDKHVRFPTYRLMSASQIREWAGRGIEFGAHSRTHSDLTALNKEEIEEEVDGSRRDMVHIVDRQVRCFAYPYGRYDAPSLAAVERSFDLAFTIEEGLNDLQTNPRLLRRTMVMPGDHVIDLASRVHLGRSLLYDLRSRIRFRTRVRHLLRSAR